MGPTRCTPVALSYKGSEGDSKLGPVAINRENIAGSQAYFLDKVKALAKFNI